MALPLGSLPRTRALAVQGSWQGRAYGPYAVLPSAPIRLPSPFAKAFDHGGIPRIRTSHAGWRKRTSRSPTGCGSSEQSPRTRDVSDGDPATITVPDGAQGDVRPRFATRVRTSG